MSEVSHADAVVIGGGILGCSAALHLLEAGVERVCLVERDGLALGTSNAGAGFLAVWVAGHVHDAWGPEEAHLERYALQFYRGLHEEGRDIGWHPNGILWVAATEAGWDEFASHYASHPEEPDAQVLGPDEIAAVAPIVAPEGVYRAVYHRSGARISARLATLGVAARVLERGGSIEEHRPVTGVRVQGGRVTAVETTRGPIATDLVVLAAGSWTNRLLAGAAPALPMVPLVAGRIVTEPLGVPSSQPPLLFPEFAHLWVREEQGGLLFGASFEARPRYDFADAAPPGRYDQLPLDGILETQRIAARVAVAIPRLKDYTSLTVAYGAPCYTPDLRGIVGAVPDVDGLFVTGGCNEAGITHGPGYGRLVAELATGRTPTVPAAPFDPGRFGALGRSGSEIVAAMAAGGRMSWVDVDRERT